jgi:hypothetical protein
MTPEGARLIPTLNIRGSKSGWHGRVVRSKLSMRIAIVLVWALWLPAQSLPPGIGQDDRPLSEPSVAPSPDEETAVILAATENALRYTKSLPDFLCTQMVTRYVESGKVRTWKLRDTLQMSVAYTAGGERYKLEKIDSRITTTPLAKVGGVQSHGEFGSLLRSIFRPEAAADFQWQRWSSLRGRRAYVYSFHIPQSRSTYSVNWATARKRYHMTTGLRGLVFVDAATTQVMRIVSETEGIPEDWPVRRGFGTLDYSYVGIAGIQFLLPNRTETSVDAKSGQSRNVSEFSGYRKFAGEASISFEPASP